MSSKRPYVKVPAGSGERTRKILIEAGLLDIGHRIIAEDGFLYLPLVEVMEHDKAAELLEDATPEIGIRDFQKVNEGPNTLSEALGGILNQDQLEILPRAYDLVGDIAVLEIPDELLEFSEQIGSAFLQIHPNFTTVLGKKGAITGVSRVREYSLLAGEDKTDATHIEYGCKIRVDLAKAYFSPRLLEEHHQVAKQVADNEIVLDMFTGVGPFPIHIAKRCSANIIALDINPDAIALLKESLKINKLVGRITPVCADARKYVQQNPDQKVNRVIMNHPSGAHDFISDACHTLVSGGILHYYEFTGGDNPEDNFKDRIHQLVEKAGHQVDSISRIRRVRDSAPYEYQMVGDIKIR
jgi:tRNA (guanine37-N1)-methyltransferase